MEEEIDSRGMEQEMQSQRLGLEPMSLQW